MEARLQQAPDREYKDFEPLTELVNEEDKDTLLIYLPSFRKDQLRVQLNRAGELIISGERPGVDNTWHRFQIKSAVSSNCDISKISAKFENFTLCIAQPKVITSAKKQDQEIPSSTEDPELKQPPNNADEKSGQKPSLETKPENAESIAEKARQKEKEKEARDRESVSEKTPGSRGNINAVPEQMKSTAADEKVKENTNQKQVIGSRNFDTEKVEGATAGVEKLKMARKVMNLVLAILLAVALGLYVKKSFSFGERAEN